MVKTLNTSPHKRQTKGRQFRDQFKIVNDFLFKNSATMKECSIKTGIDRANICWYIRSMRLSGIIAVTRKRYCSITKHLAGEYTTNPKKFPVNPQLKMF